MNKRTAIYVRVSTDDQRDNGYSIDSQIRMLKEYCEKYGFGYLIINERGDSFEHINEENSEFSLKRLIVQGNIQETYGAVQKTSYKSITWPL